MKKKRFTVFMDDVEDGTMGICVACGNTQSGAEPDAHEYRCESCGEHKVYGMEEALLMGLVDLDEE